MRLAFFLLISILLSSCVSQRVVEDLNSELENTKQALDRCDDSLSYYRKTNAANRKELTKADNKIASLKEDTLDQGNKIRALKSLNARLNESYKTLTELNDAMRARSTGRMEELMSELSASENQLKNKEIELANRNQRLNELEAELEKREQKVDNLQQLIRRKDSSLTALQKNIDQALLSYKGSGLSVKKESGRIYVTLQEKLLFETGKYKVDKKGEEALIELAAVLKKTTDVSIMVEGHTDEVPVVKAGKYDDNWELSVLRAVDVTRILTEKGGLKKERVIPAGRGPFHPEVEGNSTEARRANRRTEIILTPNLQSLIDSVEEYSGE